MVNLVYRIWLEYETEKDDNELSRG